MGVFDVRFWLIPQGRAIRLANSGSTTADGEPVMIMSFPTANNGAARLEARPLKEWLLSRNFVFEGSEGVWDGMSVDVYEEDNWLDSIRITMPIYDWQTRKITSLQQIDTWIARIRDVANEFNLRIVSDGAEIESGEIPAVAMCRISKMGFRTPPG